MAGPVGLDYGAVLAVAGVLSIPVDAVLFRKIRALERDVLREHYGEGEPDGDGAATPGRPCRHPDACAICVRSCPDRTPAA